MSERTYTEPYAVTMDPDDPQHPDHRVKVGHLVVGLVFLGLAGTWALGASGTVSGIDGALAVPLVLVAAGAIGLVAMVVGGVRRRGNAARLADQHHPTYDPYETPVETPVETPGEDTTVLDTTHSEEENR